MKIIFYYAYGRLQKRIILNPRELGFAVVWYNNNKISIGI